jgi:hypothetical protein
MLVLCSRKLSSSGGLCLPVGSRTRPVRGLPHHQYSLGSDEINGVIGFSRKCEIPDDRSVGKLTQAWADRDGTYAAILYRCSK